MSKKVLALVLTIVMVCAMGITASANTNSTADIRFTPYDGNGVVDPDPDPDPGNPELPDNIKALGAMNIHFGTREQQVTNRVYTTDGSAPLATNLAGMAVIAVGVPNWTVQLKVDEFAQIDGQTPLAGFRMSLIQEGAAPVGSNWTFHSMSAPANHAIAGTYIDAGTSHQIASATSSADNIVGAQFRSHIMVPGNSFQPLTGDPQTTFTWTYAAV